MDIKEDFGEVVCCASKMKPCTVNLRFPSVGATENIMIASALTEGKTTIINAAREPEIQNLSDFLRSMGVKIKGDGTPVISIWGTISPKDARVMVIPDRIVASTYMCASMATKSPLIINKCDFPF